MAEENSSGVAYAPSRRGRSEFQSLCGELQAEILVRLPIKSMIRFESVCKAWLFRFHSRSFIDLHSRLYRERDDFSILSLETTEDILEMVPGMGDPCTNKRISTGKHCGCAVAALGPLNGIYCFTAHLLPGNPSGFSILNAKIALYNPATHYHKLTNPFPNEFRSLLSNISTKQHRAPYLGFGHVRVRRNIDHNDPYDTDYRVVLLIHYDHGSFVALVYSAQRGVWEKIVDYEPAAAAVATATAAKRKFGKKTNAVATTTTTTEEAFSFSNMMQGKKIIRIFDPLEECPQGFFEGCYHWMAYVAAGEEDPTPTWHVLSFNFADQSFRLIGGPPAYRGDFVADADQHHRGGGGGGGSVRGHVFVLCGRLASIYLLFKRNVDDINFLREVSVWMMMEYGVEESWTRIYKMDPNFPIYGYDGACLLQAMDYRPAKGGGVRIERLLFKNFAQMEEFSIGHDAGYESRTSDGGADFHNSEVWLVTPGISDYQESLERP